MNFKKIKGIDRYNTIVPSKELFSSFFIITAIVVGVWLIVLQLNNSFPLLFVSVFAQTSQIHIDYNSLQISDRGEIRGKIIVAATMTEKGDQMDKPIHITIKAIGVGHTSIHCLNNNMNDNKHQVKLSQPFLATAQKTITVIKNTAFTLQLNPNEGNVNCDKLSVVTGPITTFDNVEVSLSQ